MREPLPSDGKLLFNRVIAPAFLRDAIVRGSAVDGWIELPPEQIAAWNQRLFQTDASVYQYPYWNESLRKPYFTPRYLVYGALDRPAVYVCVLSAGIPGALIGLVDHGPVSLLADSASRIAAVHDLVRWARRRGYIFIRFTDTDPGAIASIASVAPAKRFEPFPFHMGHTDDVIVEQLEDDSEMLATLSATARKQIRYAQRLGYELEITDSPERFAEIWPLFEVRAAKRGYRLLPLIFLLNLMRLGREYGWARLYAAHWQNRVVHASLIVRDRTTAYTVVTAIDVDGLPAKNNKSPSALLQWLAMRDFCHLGVKFYSLGGWGSPGGGEAPHHKNKFHPSEKVYSAPVTIVTNRALYHAWSAVGLRAVLTLWPRVRPIVRRFMVRS